MVLGHWEDSYYPGTITLNDNVIASGNLSDLTLSNNTYTGIGVTLQAGHDVVLKNSADPYENAGSLTGDTLLTIIAGNRIWRQNTTITVTNSELILHQGDDLNLDDFLFGNQSNTNLTLISDNGSVTAVETGTKPANAADQWASIGATADTDITLSGNTGNITTKQLTATNGDIQVNASAGQLLATMTINAIAGSVTLTAANGIVASANILAGSGITFNSDVTAIGSGQTFDAGSGKLVTVDGVDIDATSCSLTLAGDAGIELGGNLTGSGLTDTDYIILSNDVTANGTGDQSFDAGLGMLVTYHGVDIDKSTGGSLTLAGDAGIALGGNVTGSGIGASDSIILSNNVNANGMSDQSFDAGSGTLWAKGTITKNPVA